MRNINGSDDFMDGHDRVSLSSAPSSAPLSTVRTLYRNPQVLTGTVSEPDDIKLLLQYLQVAWRYKWIVLLSTFVGILVSLGISVWTKPFYYASTSLEIEPVQESFTDFTVATQIQLLSSDTLRQRAIEKLAKTTQPFPPHEDPLDSLRRLLGLADPAKAVNWTTAVSEAARTRKVNSGKDSRVLTIESRSSNPQAAADFTNTLAREYLAQNQELRWESYQNTGEWLGRAQEELKRKLEASEKRLQEFAQEHGLIITASQNSAEESFKQVQAQLGQASADLIAKRSIYESSLSSPTEALPAVLDSGPMSHYQTELADLQKQMADLSTTLTPENPKVQKLQAQIKELEAARERERQNILSRIKIDYQASEKREARLEQAFKEQSQRLSGQANELIQYNILQREVETNKKVYDQTLAEAKQAGLASAMRTNNARIVDLAQVPPSPLSPNLPLNLALGIFGGFFCGAAFVVLRSTLETRIQSPGTVELQFNLRELGIIPSAALVPGMRNRPRLLPGRSGTTNKAKRTKTILIPPARQTRESLEFITWTQKSSVISESFRAAVTSILFSSENTEQPQVLVITSPAPGEGKTTVSTNLAIALAETNQRVLLIDADMRLPRLHSIFDIPNTHGLTDFLYERRPVDEYIDEELAQKTHIPNLFVMPAGPARSNLSRLLHSNRVKELLSRLRSSFDMVLLDTPPAMTVPDARILGRAAGAVILVMRAHQTRTAAAVATVRCFEEDGCPVLGTILNDWNPKRSTFGPYGTPYGTAYSSYGP
jgi:capsular exopolysaccharide synthesis family protein